MSGRFLLGAVPSPDDPKDFSFEKSEILAGMSGAAMTSPSVVDAHDWRTQAFQDCVGMTWVAGAQIFFHIIGRPQPRMSVMMPYGGSRTITSPPKPGQLLPDVGCSQRNALKWNRDVGFVSERLWPETPENVGLTPPADVRDAASSARATTAHRIMAPDLKSFREQIRAACQLAQEGKASTVGFVMPVHDAYFDVGSSVYAKPEGKLAGYHAQPIGGIDDARDAVQILGSWGPGFGDRGLALISFECLYKIGSEFWVQEFDRDRFQVEA